MDTELAASNKRPRKVALVIPQRRKRKTRQSGDDQAGAR